jgi:hypothetical protein
MLHSGIDLHKRSLAIHTLDETGTLVRKADLPTQRDVIPGPYQAVVECTGMWDWLRDLLSPQGIDLRLAHAKYLNAISYANVKTDAVDAATLAQLLRVQLIPEAHMISDTTREIRDVLRARLLLVSRSLQCRRSVGALLEKYNVATAAELPALPRLQADLHVAQHALLVTQVKRLEAELRERVLVTPAAQRLVWVPRVGKMVAYTLLLEINDIRRFPSDSGGKTRHKRSRDGNRYLKVAFHHAAIRAVQYFPEIRAVAQRLQRRKGKPIARALIAKELATIVYAMLSKEEAFKGKFCGHLLTRTKRATWPRRANPTA